MTEYEAIDIVAHYREFYHPSKHLELIDALKIVIELEPNMNEPQQKFIRDLLVDIKHDSTFAPKDYYLDQSNPLWWATNALWNISDRKKTQKAVSEARRVFGADIAQSIIKRIFG